MRRSGKRQWRNICPAKAVPWPSRKSTSCAPGSLCWTGQRSIIVIEILLKRIVSFALRDANNSALVHETLDQVLAANPDAHPLFHSDRGFQYTTKVFHDKLAAAGMTQSMSRVGKCIDNGPMEGFWGILKRERYYGRKFTSREQLGRMIREYIAYYNFSRLQRRLGVHTPMEVFIQYRAA